MNNNRQRYLIWFGDIVAEHDLSPKSAMVLFLGQRFGLCSTLTTKCILAATKSSAGKITRLIDTLVDKGLIDEYRKLGRGKNARYQLCINYETHLRMNNLYALKQHCFRADAVFRKTNYKLKLSDMISYLALKNLQLMEGFTISIGTLEAYTGLSYNTIRHTLEKTPIATKLERTYKNIDELKTLVLYRIKEDMEEDIFISPVRFQDKVYIVSRALAKAGKATRTIKDYLWDIHHMEYDCYNATTMLSIASEIKRTNALNNAVIQLFGHPMHTLLRREYEIHGYRVIRDDRRKIA